MSTFLSFREVSKSFGGRAVLSAFSCDLPTEGLTFIMGRSGEGKSVLCRLAVGLLRPDQGSVGLFGVSVESAPERALLALRQRAPYIVQGPALLDWLTVRDNVALAAQGVDARRRTEAALAEMGIDGISAQFPPQLSPAAQKRVAIARALVSGPELLLLDEPTTGLDRRAAEQVDAVLERLRQRGLGAVVVSHDVRAVRRLADRVLVVSEGRPTFFGSADDFFTSGAPSLVRLRGE